MEEEKSEKVMIGDYLGTIEEFLLGEGTYAEEGKIYASRIGRKVVDKENHKIEVIGEKSPVELKVGQVVYGKVLSVKKTSLVVVVGKIQGYPGEIDEGVGLYVSNISNGYVSKPEDVFGIADIVKGRVIKIESNLIDITTKEDGLGVVKAFCKKCRAPLDKPEGSGDTLDCKVCGSKETRKISNDYGNVQDL